MLTWQEVKLQQGTARVTDDGTWSIVNVAPSAVGFKKIAGDGR